MSVELTDVQKEEERVKAKQYAELMGEEYVDPFPAEQQKQPDLPPVVELDDAQLLELINKRSGVVLSSLEDLKPKPTPEELAQKEEERKAAMVAYGTTSGKFTQTEYDSYQQAIANKVAVVRADIKEKFTAAFPEMAPDAIEEKVATYLFEGLDATDPVRLAREKEILTLSDLQINDKFKNIVNLPKDYAQYEEGLNNKVNFEKKVQATLPVYKTDVTRALKELQTFAVDVPDSKNPANSVSVSLEYDDKDLAEVSEMLLSNDQIIKAVKEGMTFDQIKGAAKMVLVEKHLPRLISQAAKKYSATQKESWLAARKGLSSGSDSLPVHDLDNDDRTALDKVYDEILESEEAKTKN